MLGNVSWYYNKHAVTTMWITCECSVSMKDVLAISCDI